MSKKKLFDEDSDDEVALKTENEYAKKYDAWREKEELHKLEQKYGSKPDASISTDSEEESDEPPEMSEETETQFLKTLALLKKKDPRIYDPTFKFFDGQEEKKSEKEPKGKTLTFDDSDDDDDDDDNDGNIFRIEKKAEIGHSKGSDDESRKDSKKATKDGKLKDYLVGKLDHVDETVEKDLEPLKQLWSDPKLNEGEAFLRDYILDKRYLEEGDAGDAEDKVRDDEDLEADEKIVEEQGKFERAYNFRFEEPDEEYLKRFPRTMNYIRPKDDRRSRKRAELRTRKEEEKRRKMEEIARLKALKLKEIQEKIARIKEVTGNEELAFEEEDIEGDFDPEDHDKRMKAIFDEQYYGEADDEKPVFPDLDEELEIENWEKYEPEQYDGDAEDENGEGPHCEDENFNMDADYDPKKTRENLLDELQRSMGKKRRNRKKKSKLGELLTTEKPKFVPTVADKTYDQYMEEYYKMDCEDVIGGDLPTRFKYRDVVPNDYGLTIEEILLADDKELTQWVPLKKIVKHRPTNLEKGDVKTYAQKAADVSLKKKILPSLFKELPEEPEIVVPIEEATKKQKKKKKKNKKNKSNELEIHADVIDTRTKTIDNNEDSGANDTVEKERMSIIDTTPEEDSSENNESRKKKKKRKSNGFIVENIQNEEPNHESISTEVPEKSKKNKKKHILENTSEFISNLDQNQANTSSAKMKKDNMNEINNEGSNHKKRKSENVNSDDFNQVPKKKIKKNKMKHDGSTNKNSFSKKNNRKDYTETDNPLSKLSDERLKAYGLNPKKYRSFLKYKKF